MFKKINRQFAFGPFLLSVTDRVLSCDGREIKLEPRAFDVLVFFISHPGELVNREEIKLEVWGTSHLDDNNVDQRIAAVRRALRQGDDPREYIHNNRGHGWCFKADVIKLQDNPAQEIPLTPTAPPTTESAVSSRVIAQQPFAPWYGILALVLVALAAAVLFAARGSPPPNFQPLEVQYFRLTTDGAHKDGPLVSDGRYVYFTEGATEALNRLAAAIPVGGGDILYPRSPLDPPATLLGVAQKTRDMLYGRWRPDGDSALFIWRQKEGLPKEAAHIPGDARISPDGGSIVYVIPEEGRDGIAIRDLGGRPNIRKMPVGTIPGSPAWSPDGGRIRIPVVDPVSETAVFWEVRRDGSNLHRLPLVSSPRSSFGDACWTADGRYFVYSEVSQRSANLWIRRENNAGGNERPFLLTSGPIRFDLPSPALRGKTIFARGSIAKDGVDRYDSERSAFLPFWKDVPAVDIIFSNDGAWAAYRHLADDTLWVSRSDGSDRRQLTQPPLHAYQPHWSPDGRRVAFMGQFPKQPSRIFIVSASGGQPRAVKPDDPLEQGVPSWSGDGRYLVFGELRQRRSDEDMSIRLLDLNTGKESVLPGSKAKWTPRWSADGRHIVAVATNGRSLALFDCTERRWRELAAGVEIDDPVWSLDSHYVHFNAITENGRSLFRVGVDGGPVERLAAYPPSPVRWSGVGPDGSPLVMNSTRIEDIYAINFN